MAETFASLLRSHRQSAMLSQSSLAEAAHISVSAVGAYEQGVHSSPHRETVRRLAEALNLDGNARRDFELAARRRPRTAERRATSREAHSLPLQRTSFIGREAEAARVRDLLGLHRVVTILGFGGVGKTRLALRVAEQMKATYADGVFFIDFGSLTDPRLVMQRIVAAFGRSPYERNLEAFAASLKPRSLLIVFDNCEHLAAPIGTIAAAIVRDAPHVRILATSRERLKTPDEIIFRLSTLPVPASGVASAEEAFKSSSFALFVERVLVVRPNFSLTQPNVYSVARICRRLEGIPLALELAAARLATLDLRMLEDQLARRIATLATDDREIPKRQRTLRATLEWSYALLSDEERSLFRRLGVFADGWTYEAAQAVCADAAIDGVAVSEAVSSLLDKGLIVIDEREEHPRYAMLQILRSFAIDRVVEAGEWNVLHRRHAVWLAAQADGSLRSSETHPAWHATYSPEIDNLRAALDWSMGPNGDHLIAAQLLVGFAQLWLEAGLSHELQGRISAVLTEFDHSAHPLLHGYLLLNLAVSTSTDPAERLSLCYRALDAGGAFAEADLTARAWEVIATTHFAGSELPQAETPLRNAIPLFERLKYRGRLALLYIYLCYVLLKGARESEATRYFALAVEVADTLQEDLAVGFAQANLAAIEVAMGRRDAALARYGKALAAARRGGSHRLETHTLCERAALNIVQQNVGGALRDALAAVAIAKQRGSPVSLAALEGLAAIGAVCGKAQDAAQLKGFIDRHASGARNSPFDLAYASLCATLESQLEWGLRCALEAEGTRLTFEDAVEAALAMASGARTAQKQSW